jgi:hypothetical protein
MFVGRKQQPKSRQATKEFDLDELLNSTLNHVGDDDLDMNDPELLVSDNISLICLSPPFLTLLLFRFHI